VGWETPGIKRYELRSVSGLGLPAFTAGSHVDLHLPTGMARSYSLINHPDEHDRYEIAVALDLQSRGGSRYIHENLNAGDQLAISEPKNNFPLNERAAHHVLLAGGIGITPLICMIHRLEQLQASWELHYCARSRSNAAFVQALEKYDQTRFVFDDEQFGRFINMEAVIARAPGESHFYCCGPQGMMAGFAQATSALPPERAHVEYFSAREGAERKGGFLVELSRSGRVVAVPAGRTILETLLDEGLKVNYSCADGVCGTCEVRVLAGTPDHRDSLLTEAERASGATMMICCSGSKSEKLVLDL